LDKKSLVTKICEKLGADHALLIAAAKATHEAATHEEAKPENQYDTRALENSYLAGAQSKRVGELEEVLLMYKYLQLKNFSEEDPIAPTALVETEFQNKKSLMFIVPLGGGTSVLLNDKPVQVITPASPLGGALIGLKVGDVATIEAGGNKKAYEILNVW
jgi:hypothetical protein